MLGTSIIVLRAEAAVEEVPRRELSPQFLRSSEVGNGTQWSNYHLSHSTNFFLKELF